MATLAERTRSRENNFDVLRLAAALLVVYAHSFALARGQEPAFAGATLGGLGVPVFFAISGFLIARSWALDPRPLAFIVKRVLRLWPALLVVLLFSSLVLGAAVTHVPLADYFRSPRLSEYVVENARLHTTFWLPGVFDHNPLPSAVNGSLWTLPAEVKAYAIVLALGLAGLLRRPLALVAALELVIWLLVADGSTRPQVLAHQLGSPAEMQFIALFVGSALLFSLRNRIPLDWRLALAATVAAALASRLGIGLRTTAWALTVPYIVVFLAFCTPAWLRVAVRPGDLSYGIYIWAFPVQQTLMWINRDFSPVELFALAAPLTWGVAFVSWRCIEAPALRLKRRLRIVGAVRPTPAIEAGRAG
jgi:peptidoglycan/LPS O-acetylase OafA/YrhL